MTRCQSLSHFLRQVKGRSQIGHTLVGKFDFLMVLPLLFNNIVLTQPVMIGICIVDGSDWFVVTYYSLKGRFKQIEYGCVKAVQAYI